MNCPVRVMTPYIKDDELLILTIVIQNTTIGVVDSQSSLRSENSMLLLPRSKSTPNITIQVVKRANVVSQP
jgi:hypothetical protein